MDFKKRLFIYGVLWLPLLASCSPVNLVAKVTYDDSAALSDSKRTYDLKIYVVSPNEDPFPSVDYYSYYKTKATGDKWLGRTKFGVVYGDTIFAPPPYVFYYTTPNQLISIPVDATHVFLNYEDSVEENVTLWINRLSMADTQDCIKKGDIPTATVVRVGTKWESGRPKCEYIHE